MNLNTIRARERRDLPDGRIVFVVPAPDGHPPCAKGQFVKIHGQTWRVLSVDGFGGLGDGAGSTEFGVTVVESDL